MQRAYFVSLNGGRVFFLHWKSTTRRRLFASIALVFGMLGGAAEPLCQSFQDQFAVSPQRDLVAPRPFTSVSLGGPTKLKSGISFRKNGPQALAPNAAIGTALQSSGFLFLSCNVRCLAADVTLGFGRSPPSLL
jgi:hypothetical protein